MRVEGELIRGRAAVEGRIIGPVLDPPKGICESARLTMCRDVLLAARRSDGLRAAGVERFEGFHAEVVG